MLLMLAGVRGLPRSIVAMEFLLAIVSVGGLRFSVRAMSRMFEPNPSEDTTSVTRILIAGAGDTGETLLREINRKFGRRFLPVGFVDDNPGKQGATIHGVRVLGLVEDLARIAAETKVDQVVVAIPSLRGRDMRRIVDLAAKAKVSVRTLPGYEYLIDGRITVNQIRNVQIEDLLGRDAVKLDQASLAAMIGNKSVMVTGAGGSIGSELCRQIARFKPAKLILLEQAENALYQVHREMRRSNPDMVVQPCIADIVDRVRLDEIMSRHQPTLILHAAAHKHVPMMEWNASEAVKNNVGGTRALADAAHTHGVERF
ncbi:MAG: polysaccharide biosynthesis protein, partial [Rhodobacterales bacterium]|nr:polysaccharide biosynthesis protein [Rhodobacterales bacterium]